MAAVTYWGLDHDFLYGATQTALQSKAEWTWAFCMDMEFVVQSLSNFGFISYPPSHGGLKGGW